MKKLTALHLADVCLRRADEQARAPALHALLQDVRALLAAGRRIDAIFFSGQLVAPDACAGTTPAHAYESFLLPLLQAASLPGSRFYLVPDSSLKGGVPAGQAGFSFFAAEELHDAQVDAQQRALYRNLHAVFHRHAHGGEGHSLMKALAILYKSSPGRLSGARGQTPAYALLEFGADAAASEEAAAPACEHAWTVALHEFDAQGSAFGLSVLYTPNGHDSSERDAEYVFATLLPQLAGEGSWLNGLLGRRVEASDEAVQAREFLTELALTMFESQTLFLQQHELNAFADDYCAVRAWSMPSRQWLARLYAQGLLVQVDGQVVFAYDYFRSYFLAQRFATSFDLRRYAPEKKGGRSAIAT